MSRSAPRQPPAPGLVIAFASVGMFAHYVADDFCTNVEVRDAGMLGAQLS